MDRRKFITTCACCAFASMGATFLNEHNLSKDIDNSVMHHVEVHIAEHCNLKCKYCFHFSCIAEKEFYELDKFDKDMAQMAYVLKGYLRNIQLLGGEPLLTPEIEKYFEISRKHFPNATISLITNGILLDDMNETFWRSLNKTNINIIPSVYPVKINWASVIDKAKKYNVDIFADYNCKDRLTADKIDKYYKDTFLKLELNKDGNYNQKHSKCIRKYRCNTMKDGRFYPCSAIANVRHFNKKYDLKFEVTDKDYIDLYKAKDANEVKEFLRTTQPFCNFCSHEFKRVKWESSASHDISEWT